MLVLDKIHTSMVYSVTRGKKFWANRKESKMDKKKISKIVDGILIISLTATAGVKLIEWFPELTIVVLLVMLLAYHRLIR